MNVIFISPHYPRHFYNFCERLKSRGVNVLGIGDCPWDAIGERCQNALTDYRAVASLQDYESVYRADFNISSGPKPGAMADMNHKSRMKKAYERAEIPAARWLLPESEEQALAFAEAVGYPVILKPDQGMGASDTHRIDSGEELRDFWREKNPSERYIEEECVPGHVETFDGITDSRKQVLFCASQVLPRSLMDAAHGDDIVSYCQAVPGDLRRYGERLLQEFDTRNKFFHFEFFRLDQEKKGLGKKGELVGLEVNMRAPGGRIPDKMNYAFETDVYTIWADSLIYDRCFMESEFRHFITHIGRRRGIPYVHTVDEIRRELRDGLLEDFEVDPVLAADMGDHAFLLRAEDEKKWRYQMDYVLERR